MLELLVLLLIVGGLIALAVSAGRGRRGVDSGSRADAEAEARRWYERLGGQVLSLQGSDDASRQALADASERYTAAGSQLQAADSPARFRLVSDTALEGLYYVRAARTAMGMDPGPELPGSAERARAGSLSDDRSVDVGDRSVLGSPQPSARTNHYYPGGMVQGRPVPAGWYSEPWWKPMLLGGAGAVGGVMLADALFSGFGGHSTGWGGGALGGDWGAGDWGAGDWGGGDWGGGDWGGGDFGGGDLFGGGDDWF